jgi:anthranilate phosphoribosyltransferase
VGETFSWPTILSALMRGEDLDADATAWAMGEIMTGEATPAQIAGFAVALHTKGETVAEVDGLTRAMYERATPITVSGRAVDVVGSGGDRAHTVNISTMAALVTAGAGVRVVKHGNRAASSACGAADLLEELGIRLDLPVSDVARLADEVGITFCFAPVFHPALRHAAAPRRELGVPTTFNFLGPLCNPARPAAQAVGVADSRMAAITAGVLAGRGVSALVFRGDDGLDELTTTTTSTVWIARDGGVRQTTLDPGELGIPPASPQALRGGDPSHNADVARRVLSGERGPIRDAVLLNAAAALVAYEPGGGELVTQLRDALERARVSVDEGAAAAVLEHWIAACQQVAR